MTNIVVKSPDGKYCIFSTVVDNFIWWDMNKQDIEDFFVEITKKEAIETAKRRIETADNSDLYQIKLELIGDIHGLPERKKVEIVINNNISI